MYLDYVDIEFDSYGRPEKPELILKTMSDDVIGVISNTSDLRITLNYSEISEMSFNVSSNNDGVDTKFYDDITGYKIIYTKNYGVFITSKPETTNDGITETKSVVAYSREKELETKKFYIEEGTFPLWDPTNYVDVLSDEYAQLEDTSMVNNSVLARIIEVCPGWRVGYISPTLLTTYRTFTDVDDYALSFLRGTAQDKFRCVFVFDPYEKTINAYDADEEHSPIPIYLGLDNLLEKIEVSEMTDELVTAMRPYGADMVDIREVNPIASNWIYDLSYFISNGDIKGDLASKWNAWAEEVNYYRDIFTSNVLLKSNATSRLLVAKAALVDAKNKLETYKIQQNVLLQQKALDPSLEDDYSNIVSAINNQETVIATCESNVEDIENEINDETQGYNTFIHTITDYLSISNYFTKEERTILNKYFIEQDLSDETFVATDVDMSMAGNLYNTYGGSIVITAPVYAVNITDLSKEFAYSTSLNVSTINKTLYSFKRSDINLSTYIDDSSDDVFNLRCTVVSATMDIDNITHEFVLSVYAIDIYSGGNYAKTGMITMTGSNSSVSVDDYVASAKIVNVNLNRVDKCTLYITSNITDYKKYSVQRELYEFALKTLNDVATPTYEFSVESSNFLFVEKFEHYRKNLELGSSIYLKIKDDYVINPILIGLTFDFEDISSLSLEFSNRFKKYDNVANFKDMIQSSYSTSRSFDSSKYIYKKTTNQSSIVSQYMSGQLESAVNNIIAASNQSVVIDGAGINVSSGTDNSSDCEIRIVNNMIAITHDKWATASLAIGELSSESGTVFGVNAEVIAGKLIVGNAITIESEKSDGGVYQFKVDSDGVWLSNTRLYLTSSDGMGNIFLDPEYGVVAGYGSEFKYTADDDGNILPDIFDDNGNIVTEDDSGNSNGVNFYVDINSGDVFLRGTIYSTSGEIGGWTIGEHQLYGGERNNFVCLNIGEQDAIAGRSIEANGIDDTPSYYYQYAIWAGAEDPMNAPFWVKRDGTMRAVNATFSGDVTATSLKVNGNDIIGGNFISTEEDNGKTYLKIGSITIDGDNGSITFDDPREQQTILVKYSTTESFDVEFDTWQSGWTTANVKIWAKYSYDGGETWVGPMVASGKDGKDGEPGTDGSDANIPGYIHSTYIASTEIRSPNIVANEFNVSAQSGSSGGSYNMYGYYSGNKIHVFSIEYYAGDSANVVFSGGTSGAYAMWEFPTTYYPESAEVEFGGPVAFEGTVDFSRATVTGLNLGSSTATFG